MGVCAMLLAVSGCGGSPSPSSLIDFEDVNLNGVIAAITLYQDLPYSIFPQRPPDTGYVALIREDGSASYVRIGHLESTSPLWTDKGLAFADQYHDYLVGADGDNVMTSVGKTDWQTQLVSDADGYAIGAYDNGYKSAGGYEMVVVRHLPQSEPRTQRFTLPSFPFDGIAICDGQPYAISHDVSQMSDDAMWLWKLEPQAQPVTVPLGGSDLEFTLPVSSLPCNDGIIREIVERDGWRDAKGEPIDDATPLHKDLYSPLEIMSWNVADNTVRFLPLHHHDGVPFLLNQDNFIDYGSGSLQGEELLLLNKTTGDLYSTNTGTGITERVFTMPPDGESESAYYRYQMIAGEHTIALFDTYADDGHQPRLIFLDRSRMSITRIVTLDRSLSEIIRQATYYVDNTRGFAISPTQL